MTNNVDLMLHNVLRKMSAMPHVQIEGKPGESELLINPTGIANN